MHAKAKSIFTVFPVVTKYIYQPAKQLIQEGLNSAQAKLKTAPIPNEGLRQAQQEIAEVGVLCSGVVLYPL